ncbi:hypothetical protein M4L90_00205 [Staphylococcus equorum]|uniref:Bacterial Ig domain-containing protein n=2 Tax=Staphylococcus equorum TaxID=246432 RepID=A0A9X4QZI1_9STAP|nr:hypothetical protein [Staphylococcus equorum]MDG0818311.1 hypothetical protein [Staphylococcus equorum]MDG0838953.1 hypothetical protein [Staphylococcus equorum]MDG0845322.1 hypothetical protein [Staphylococcus equorum]
MDTLNFVKSKGLVSLMVAALIISLVGVFNSASAASIDNPVEVSKKDDSTVHLKLKEGIKGTQAEDGAVTLTVEDGESKELPTEVEKDGETVKIKYTETDDGYDMEVLSKETTSTQADSI